MNLRRTIVAGLAVLLASVAGCTSGSTVNEGADPGAGGGDKKSIALISKGFQHQFWQAVKQGAQEKADELGYQLTFDGPAAETEVDAQLQMFQAAIDRKPGAIGFAALDPEACIPLMDTAKQANIPVVEFDAGCDSDVPLNISKTDSEAAGALAADHMAGLIGEAGRIAVVAHSQVNSTAVERRDGFINRMKEKYPKIEIVDTQYGDGDHLKSSDIAKSMIAAHPDLKGLYGTNEGSAIGIVNAVGELNLEPGKLTIVGFDSGKAQIDAIKSGVMAGAITQDPIGIGRSTVESAVKAIEGQQIEKVIDTGSYWYDKTNLDDPKIASVLYQ